MTTAYPHRLRPGLPVTPRQFSDLAAALARHAGDLSGGLSCDPPSVHRVWKRSTRCFGLWRDELIASATPRLYANIFAAELPIRVWCTSVSCNEPRRDRPAPAIAAKVFSEMLDLRCVALQALAADHGLTAAEAAKVDRFRRRCERWADVLIGALVARGATQDFAVCADRADEFANELREEPQEEGVWSLVSAGLHLAFTSGEDFRGECSDASASSATSLSAAIFASFPPSSFSSDGRFRTPGVGRIARTVQETAVVKARQPIVRPPAKPASPPPVETSRGPHSISFSPLRKRRDTE